MHFLQGADSGMIQQTFLARGHPQDIGVFLIYSADILALN
jgi:hypothetical protein